MAKKVYPIEGLEADPERVTQGATHMFQHFQEYMVEKEWSVIDAFMIAHSFHKLVVLQVMAMWSVDGLAPEKTLHLADMTWRNAIQSIVKNLKPTPPVRPGPSSAEQIAQDYRSVVLGSPKAKAGT